MRVVGKAGIENKWQNFLVDETGKEYDPEDIAELVWSYLERTGDAQTMDEAFRKDGQFPIMTVVAIKPLVVILEPNQNTALQKQLGGSLKRYHRLHSVYTERHPQFKEGLQWFSPDLEQRLIALIFSQDGVAEIKLKAGKLKLIRESDKCNVTRE
jgi:hypothetical protein